MTVLLLAALAFSDGGLRASFEKPPASCRPDVYWYFMEGNMTRQGIAADLADMKQVGLGGGIFLEVNIGIPRGPVQYMSPEWLSLVGFAVKEADRLGLTIDMGTGPGWCGTGGPWVTPEHAMQHLVSSEVNVRGRVHFSGVLPQPLPRTPFFGLGTLTPTLHEQWADFYRDEAVVAIRTRSGIFASPKSIEDLDGKSLVYRGAYSSQPNVPEFLRPSETIVLPRNAVDPSTVINLSSKMGADGSIEWDVPEGSWTILRFGRTLTGQTSRPAPDAGLGFETDKFDSAGIEAHLDHFIDAIVKESGPNRLSGRGLTSLHFDSWEMGSQNWSANFRKEFTNRRGYDPLPYLPVMAGHVVGSMEISEKFLWDLRMTAQELVIDNHIGAINRRAAKYGLGLSLEPYDLNPTTDLDLGGAASEPMGEFWSKGFGFDSEYSVFEAVSAGHTNGRAIIGAESFTSDDSDRWLQYPGSMKAQADWALAAGINQIYFHRYEHQPEPNKFPGMTMGPYGVHWERTETWWDMVPAFHEYLSRCSYLLRQGKPVMDILYLVPEGAPNVFKAPSDATLGVLPDKKSYSFDACSPQRLVQAAKLQDGRIVFPDGMSYRVLVLPRVKQATPQLMRKLEQLVHDGATIVGMPKSGSPSLVGGRGSDIEVRAISGRLFSPASSTSSRSVGKGMVIRDNSIESRPLRIDDARWIWTREGDARREVPVGRRTFKATLTLPKGKSIRSATAAFTADNAFLLKINGQSSISGRDFHHIVQSEVQGLLHEGRNQISVEVSNDGSAPNPAGLIGAVDVEFDEGTHQKLVTDGAWTTSSDAGVGELGDWRIGPWNLNEKAYPTPEMYPSFESTAKHLRKLLHVEPDLQSGDGLRYIHRRTNDKDIYFVANRSGKEFFGDVTFRVGQGSPQWWDPMTGETRPLFEFEQNHGVTKIPFRLDENQSGFVVFDRTLKAVVRQKSNFPARMPVAMIRTGWNVSFDPRFGGPPSARFESLTDWKNNEDPTIRHYSGKATYRTQFDASRDFSGPTELSLGDVRNAAHVWLNGHDLGVAWCAPFRVKIPSGVLRRKGNRLEIQVANLWANRLIYDAGLPPDKRVTETTWNPYRPTDPLLPSGLLGPVAVMKRN